MSEHDRSLAAPFKPEEIEWRISQSGKSAKGLWANCVAYITSRAIMDRLDTVLGSENWKVSYEFHGETGVICNLSLKFNGEWVTKQDGAEMTNIESFKGGISSALKRAGSAWGLGRYLYGLDTGFAKIVEKGAHGAYYAQTKEKEAFYWLPPTLPDWALPKADAQPSAKKTSPIKQSAPADSPETIVPFGSLKGRKTSTLSDEDLKKGIKYAEDRSLYPGWVLEAKIELEKRHFPDGDFSKDPELGF